MQAARALRLVGRGGHRLELQDGSDSNDDDDSSSSGNNGASTASQRRDVWNMHPMLVQRQETVTTTPLQLVAQLRRDYAAFSEEVYGSPPSMSSIEDFRTRRQRERLQLDSLHARLHGLRLILAMARTRLLRARLLRARARTLLFPVKSNPVSRDVPKPNPLSPRSPHPPLDPCLSPPPLGAELQVAAETEMERVEFFGGDDSDDPSGVFLVSMAPRRAPEPIGVPAKKIEEIMPELEASAADVEVTCSICICELEEGETIRCMPNCSHKFHSKCIDRWFERSVACPNCKAPVCEVEAPPPEEQGSPLSVFSRLTPNISISSTIGSITGPVILPGRVAAPRRPPESAPDVSVNGNLLQTTPAPAYGVQAAMAASPLLSERLSAITPSPAAIAATAAAAAATTAAAAGVTPAAAAAASRPASPAATAVPAAVRAPAARPSAMISGISGSAPLTGMAAARASGIAAAAAARAREEAEAAARAASAAEATTTAATAATTTSTTSTGASTSATTTAPTPSALSSSAASAATTASGPATAVPASAATAPSLATVSTATTRASGAAASSVRTASPSATRAAATRTAPTRAAVSPAASSATAAAPAVPVAA